MDICKLRGEPCGHLQVERGTVWASGSFACKGKWGRGQVGDLGFLQANSIDKYPVEVPIDMK